MKKVIGIYLMIGLILTPFIYANNAEGYRPSRSKAYSWGGALGSSVLYWPSYLFSIEPTVDSKDLVTFQKSILKIVDYRDKKLFTGAATPLNRTLVLDALGACLIAAGIRKDEDPYALYDRVFKSKNVDQNLDELRRTVMSRFNGFDFADIVHERSKCQFEWGLNDEKSDKTSHAASAPSAGFHTVKPVASSGSKFQNLLTSTEQNMPKKSPEQTLKDAEKESLRARSEEWQQIVANPGAYLDKCIREEVDVNVKLGGTTESKARSEAKTRCSIQLTQLNQCMKKPDARADYCFDETLYTGD